ncbi:MAG TPA: hypothetical protein VGE88_09620 [Lysobacter sp.]
MLKVVAPDSFQRPPARERGIIGDISSQEASALLGPPHASVEDPRRTASGTEEWWVFEVAGTIVGLCHCAVANSVVVHAPAVNEGLKTDLGRCFADRRICWL